MNQNNPDAAKPWPFPEKSPADKAMDNPHAGHPFDPDDFILPPTCPLRNEGDDLCEACQ